jgi:hypothetical protein
LFVDVRLPQFIPTLVATPAKRLAGSVLFLSCYSLVRRRVPWLRLPPQYWGRMRLPHRSGGRRRRLGAMKQAGRGDDLLGQLGTLVANFQYFTTSALKTRNRDRVQTGRQRNRAV